MGPLESSHCDSSKYLRGQHPRWVMRCMVKTKVFDQPSLQCDCDARRLMFAVGIKGSRSLSFSAWIFTHWQHLFRKVQTLRCPQERRGITRIIVRHHCKPPITETQEFKNGNSQICRVRPQRFELRRCRISSSLDPSSPFATSLMTTSRFFLGGAKETRLQRGKFDFEPISSCKSPQGNG